MVQGRPLTHTVSIPGEGRTTGSTDCPPDSPASRQKSLSHTRWWDKTGNNWLTAWLWKMISRESDYFSKSAAPSPTNSDTDNGCQSLHKWARTCESNYISRPTVASSGNSKNQNAFLSESKLNPKGKSPSIIYNFSKPKVWGTTPATAWVIYIKQDNFFSALPGVFRLQTVQEDSSGTFFVVQNQKAIFLHFRHISPSSHTYIELKQTIRRQSVL